VVFCNAARPASIAFRKPLIPARALAESSGARRSAARVRFPVSALLDAVATIKDYKRVILAFQPHTFSRTKALFSDFVKELKRADVTFLSEIYAARESNEVQISSSDLAAHVKDAKCVSNFPDLINEIKSIAKSGDIILTVGAGDIYRVGEDLVSVDSTPKVSDSKEPL